MIPLAEVEQVVEADRLARERGTPTPVLMGRAGVAVARVALGLLAVTAGDRAPVAGRRVVALAGKGHNGGDAMEALARLARRGAGAEVLLTADEATVGPEVARCVRAVRRAGGRVRRFEPALARRLLAGADLALDGLLGTGASGAPRGDVAAAIAALNAAPVPVVAVDIASGVDGGTGAVEGDAVRATATVTFQAAKPGHVLAPGSEHTGELAVVDIGMPLRTSWGLTEPSELAALVPVPSHDTNKYDRGVLLLVAGSVGMAGAAVLAARAARHAGTGLLVVGAPPAVLDHVGMAVPEAITVPLPVEDGGINPAAVGALARWLDRADALAVGPGLGRAEPTGAAVVALLEAAAVPAVVDADALHALGTGEALRKRPAPTLLTPHEGEFKRLAPEAAGTRLHRAAGRAAAWGATVLLKGDDTVIADAEGRIAVNGTGTAVLATGGTGDVLTGLAGSLLAQGLGPFDAARLAAWAHGRAGSIAADALGPVSVAAGDVADHLPDALTELVEAGGREREAAGR